MNQQKRINKIIEAVESRIQDEVGALLGADFTLLSDDRKIIDKDGVFDNLLGKQICAHLDISGEIDGKGCLLIGIKDAVRLGGTLIMLPAGELEEVIGREDYSEEIEDSFGEIANIIAGSLTKDFEEMFPKACRFVRKEQEIVLPAKVEPDSDSPIENQRYYQVGASMVLDGRQMGNMFILFPAVAFDLYDEAKDIGPGDNAAKADGGGNSTVAQEMDPPRPEVEETTVEITAAEETDTEETAAEDNAADKDLAKPQKDLPAGRKIDFAKQQKKIDRLLADCHNKMESELSALLGVDFILSGSEHRLLNKEGFFQEEVSGRQVLADMEVTGEVAGKSYFAVGIKDAIHLGGKLIMLPPAELENVIKEEDFGEDCRDAFGEIANIVSGVYTAVFEEQYSQKLRFIRKDFRDTLPAKIDIASDEPIPDSIYYISSISMNVEGNPLGKAHMLFPAELLHLDAPEEKVGQAAQTANVREAGSTSQSTSSTLEPNSKTTAPEKTGVAPSRKQSPAEIKKQKKRIDKILTACRDRMVDEVGALLGTDIKLSNLDNTLVSKEQFFFEEVSGSQVIAEMDVLGDLEGKSYLSVSLRDAIRIGGTLIMIPASEIETVVAEEHLNEDIEDAYGEITNIIAGVYTSIFEEQYSKQLRFVKTGLQQVAPMKVDIDGDQPIADRQYYLSRMDIRLGELDLGKVNILFPTDLLQLDGLGAESAMAAEGATISSSAEICTEQGDTARKHDLETGHNATQFPDILVVGDDNREAAKIAEVLGRSGYSVKTLSFKDNLHSYIPGNLKAIYLVMQNVNEQTFGVAIKISSACSVPLIAAGPAWTRTKVIKAVKYGVRDILLTPASEEDIEENVENNLLELAA